MDQFIVTSLAPGSRFSWAGQEFVLHQAPDAGGFTWLNADGINVLSQHCYPDGLLTPEYLNTMAKYYCPR